MERKTVYTFVGVPNKDAMYSQIVNGTDDDIECEIDKMLDLMYKTGNPVWMTAPVESVSFEQAVTNFVKYMQFKANESNVSESVGA